MAERKPLWIRWRYWGVTLGILISLSLGLSLSLDLSSVMAQPKYYHSQLQEAVADQDWTEALDLLDRLIILQPQHRPELEAYRQQVLERQQLSSTDLAPTRSPGQAFDFTLRFLDDQFSDSHQAAIIAAARRWEEVVIGDLPEYGAGIGPSRCSRFIRQGTPAYLQPIDDVLVDFIVSGEDDPGKQIGNVRFLARALTCVKRGTQQGIYGVVQFEERFLQNDSGSEFFYQVSLHELAHILGLVPRQAVRNPFSNRPTFVGSHALEQFHQLGGVGDIPVQSCYADQDSLIRDCGGAHGHWDAQVFPREVLTNGGLISPVSVGALMDLGYEVDLNAADPFTLGEMRSGSE